MERHRAPTPRRTGLLLTVVAGVLAVVAVVAGVLAVRGGSDREAPTARAADGPVVVRGSASAVATTSGAHPSTPVVLAPLPATPAAVAGTTTPAPVSMTIPSLGVASPLEPLGLQPDGTLTPPSTYGRAGWYAGGTRPGDIGPAAIVGHVDSYRGPGVFYRLRDIAAGARVTVTRADRSTVEFVVESVAEYPKHSFPADVFAPTPTPVLLLITCTGTFDRSARSYLDNLVVTAVPG
jgi:hypothetical protein